MIQITVECNSYPRFYDGTFICKNCGCITFHCGTSVLPLGWTKEEYYSGCLETNEKQSKVTNIPIPSNC